MPKPTFRIYRSEKRGVPEKEQKLKLISDNLSKSSPVDFDPKDFRMDCDFTYEMINLPTNQLFPETSPNMEIGKSNNFLFFPCPETLAAQKSINFDISNILDSNGNNLLHYAALRNDVERIKILIENAKNFGNSTVKKLVNHRNIDGTTPLGMTFLIHLKNDDEYNIDKLKIASIFVELQEYDISSYLNNNKFMDFSNNNFIGGTNILHNVLRTASVCSNTCKSELSSFFNSLKARIRQDEDDFLEIIDDFNPNYPTMNPNQIAINLDGHMISTKRLLDKLDFASSRIKKICEKYFKALVSNYEARQFEDDSGDSEEENTSANDYKEMLLVFDKFYSEILGENYIDDNPNSNANFTRRLDNISSDHSPLSPALQKNTSKNNKPNPKKWDEFWQSINEEYNHEDEDTEDENTKETLDSFMVPLFHGVPFMQSQYTNSQRREVAKTIFTINKKLLNRWRADFNNGNIEESKKLKLTETELAKITIHSRTATATHGMKSLHEIMTASADELKKLAKTDKALNAYLKKHKESPKGFKNAMKDYIFNFATSPIENFWKSICQETLIEDSDDLATIVKYRFPIIATAKAPDHALRFGIGRSVEGNRGETAMQPEYVDGIPTHRLAGLLYVTLHNLKEFRQLQNNGHMIDANQKLSSGEIKEGRGAIRFKNQLECDFFGEIDPNSIVAVIPIIYPSIKQGNDFMDEYHQSIFGINQDSRKNQVTSPEKILSETKENPNPKILNESTNVGSFGKLMIPTFVNIANALAAAVAKAQDKFLCTIMENGELIPYEIGFDQKNGNFSKAQIRLTSKCTKQVENRVWDMLVNDLITEGQSAETPETLAPEESSEYSINVENRGWDDVTVGELTEVLGTLGLEDTSE